ncbi:MAG: hypothetical protein ACOVOQ_05425 [Flavobacterium sp.]|jgi:hypothetical protein
MKIKDEFKGKVIVKYDSVLGQKRIEVDKLDPARFNYYQSIGLGYLFEPEAINYTGIEQEETEEQAEKPKRRRKKSE